MQGKNPPAPISASCCIEKGFAPSPTQLAMGTPLCPIESDASPQHTPPHTLGHWLRGPHLTLSTQLFHATVASICSLLPRVRALLLRPASLRSSLPVRLASPFREREAEQRKERERDRERSGRDGTAGTAPPGSSHRPVATGPPPPRANRRDSWMRQASRARRACLLFVGS
jgi:hypothetical protein